MLQYLVNAISLGGIYALFTLGLSLSWGVLNVLNLAHGAIFMAGALGSYEIASRFSAVPFVVVLLFGMLVGAVLAAAAEFLVFRVVRRKARSAHDADLATLIASIAISAVIIAVGQRLTGGVALGVPDDLFPVRVYTVAGVSVSSIQLLIDVLAVLLTVGAIVFVRRTRIGRGVRAVAFDRRTSGLVGIDSERLSLLVIGFSGAVAGLAGVLLSVRLSVVDVAMGEPLLFKAFVVIIIAGVGSITWAFIGSIVLAVLETFMTAYSTASLRDLVVFGLIMIFLAVRPQGVAGKTVHRV